MTLTYDEAKAEIKDLYENNYPAWCKLRDLAVDHMLIDWPEGEGLGSSDMFIGMVEYLRFETQIDWKKEVQA